MKKLNYLSLLFVSILFLINASNVQAQINLNNMDAFINDTLLIEPGQLQAIGTLEPEIQKTLSFKPKKDGSKTYHFINGEKYSSGIEENQLPEGLWISWYKNGSINKKINFIKGKKEGAYESWYENGNKNAKGNFKNDLREGTWAFYNKDGSIQGTYKYKKGELKK